MGLFKAKVKEVEEFETDMSLPAFWIDSNGFIMFEDRTLGGAAVFEVIPHVTTESITHEDPVFHNECTELENNPTYDPSNNMLFGDSRGVTYPGWVNFLNSLQARTEAEEPIHIQVLAKKCRSEEWYNKIDYACYMAHKQLDPLVYARDHSRDPRKAMLGARADDYIALLEHTKKVTDELPYYARDIRKFAAYKTKFYLVLSYTPSGEGWWLDGRDSDYYITDNSTASILFAGNEDKLVDKVAGILHSRMKKKDSSVVGGAEDDFFWIESDRTAQVLTTRIHKMMNSIKKWNKENRFKEMPFHLVQPSDREVAALIRFFPNILTPYWDKIGQLQSDQNELLYSKDVERAIQTGDASLIDQHELFQEIKNNTVDLRHDPAEQEAFLARYKDKAYVELNTLESDHDDLLWSPEQEEQEQQRMLEAAAYQSDANDLWHDFDASFALADELKTPAQQREEFLDKYRKRGQYTGTATLSASSRSAGNKRR